MEIILKVVQCPPESDMAGLTIKIDESGASIGRAATNTLALPDPNRYVSSLHAKIQFSGEQFEIIDQSTNGTFLNNLSQALIKGQPQVIADQDQILMGPFVLEVEVVGVRAAKMEEDPTSITNSLDDTTSLTIPPNDPGMEIDDLDRWLEPDAPEPESLPRLQPAGQTGDDSLVAQPDKELDPLAALGRGQNTGGGGPGLNDGLNDGLNNGLDEGNWGAAADNKLPILEESGSPDGMIPNDWDRSMVLSPEKNADPNDASKSVSELLADSMEPPGGLGALAAGSAADAAAGLNNPGAGAGSGEGGADSLLDLVNTPSEQLKQAAESAPLNNHPGDPLGSLGSGAESAEQPAGKATEAFEDPFADLLSDADPVDPAGNKEKEPFFLDDTGISQPTQEPPQPVNPHLPIDPSDSQVNRELSNWLDLPEPEPMPPMRDEAGADKGVQPVPPRPQQQSTPEQPQAFDPSQSPPLDQHADAGSLLDSHDPAALDAEGKIVTRQSGEDVLHRSTNGPTTDQFNDLLAAGASPSTPPREGASQADSSMIRPVAKRRATGPLQIPPADPAADSLIDVRSNRKPPVVPPHNPAAATSTSANRASPDSRPPVNHSGMSPNSRPSNVGSRPASPAATGNDYTMVRKFAESMGMAGLSDQQLAELMPLIANFVVMTVDGLMGALRARQTIKNEFRMNLTMIQAVENNPLKFSLSTEDAIENLFVKRRKAYLSATEAAGEAFADIADHQLALFNGIRAAYDELMIQFDPERLEKRFERQRGKALFGRSGKKWEAYQDFIEELNEDQERTFKHLFGEVFAEQYERSFEELKAKRRK